MASPSVHTAHVVVSLKLLNERRRVQLTLVEDGQEASSESAQEAKSGGARTRGSRRPKVSLDEGREIARLYADASMPTSEIRARFGIGESSLYRIIQRQGISLRGHIGAATAPATQPAPAVKTGRKRTSRDGRQAGAPLAAAAPAPVVAEHASATAPATRGRRARRASVAQPQTPAVITQAGSNGMRFRIRYLGERVFEAQTIRDALRQAESLGATEITGVARED
jgi:hypothetical protein